MNSNESGLFISGGFAESASSGGDDDYTWWDSDATVCGSVRHEQVRRSQLHLGQAGDWQAEYAAQLEDLDNQYGLNADDADVPTGEDQLYVDEAADGGSSVVSIRSTRD